MRRICCPLECGSLQVVAATRHTRSSINRFIDRAGDAGRRAGGCCRRRRRRAGAPATAGAPASAEEASKARTGAWCGSWPWGNPRNGSWPWGNPRNDFPAILRSKDQNLLNCINMNFCCKEEKLIERDHGFSTACLSMTSHYVPGTVD